MSFASELLARGREAAARGRSRMGSPRDAYQWDALDQTLDAVERRLPVLEDLGQEGFESVLRQVIGATPSDARLQLLAEGTADDLIAWSKQAGEEVGEDTGRRRKQKAELVDLLLEVGQVGLRILLGLLVVA